MPVPGHRHLWTWSLCCPAGSSFCFSSFSRAWLWGLVLKRTAAKTSINCSAESAELAGRLLQDSTSRGDPTMQQSVRSGAGGTHTELSKVDPYSDDRVSRCFILSLFLLEWEVGNISHGSFLTILPVLLTTLWAVCRNGHHIAFV